jgi:hypothetical protein
MGDPLPFVLPSITDEDIEWALQLLRLPAGAFGAADSPRAKLLKNTDSIDVAACPGSGKTTLLVAKLAIMAAKWRCSTRGICVLSHTNAARNEIENRLGGTSVGRVLLSYPHFIGTIHGFVNDFLAIPWLRSQKYRVSVIDNEACQRRRWYKLQHSSRSYLTRKQIDESAIRIINTSFAVAKKKGVLPCGEHTPTYRDLQDVSRKTAEEGYHCFDDMFMWARDLLDRRPHIAQVIRERFPLLLLDEAQDNSEDQSEILFRIFRKGPSPVVRQRFGDGNQAIFDSVSSVEASTDGFPDDRIKQDLPSSHRFGSGIAKLVSPLGLTPHPHGLEGIGPRIQLSSGASEGQHTLFLFDDSSASGVFDAYGALLLDTFHGQELKDGIFTAVGQVHHAPEVRDLKKVPHCLGDYWSDYDPRMTPQDPKPQLFVQYVAVGVARGRAVGSTYPAVEKIGEAVAHLVGLLAGRPFRLRYRSYHRHIMELLRANAEVYRDYMTLAATLAIDKGSLTRQTWDERWCQLVRGIAQTITGIRHTNAEAELFLSWLDHVDFAGTIGESGIGNNLYLYPRNAPMVTIRAGSIHSVKGQTHTATLVLETFWMDKKGRHNLELLRPWLEGTKSGGQSEKATQQKRLKIHYVAMTRPTHLLCLAMKRNSLADAKGEVDQTIVRKLKANGWHVQFI